MSIDRTLILKGPCKAVFDSATIFFNGDLTVTFITDYFDVQASAFGRVDRRVQARRIEVTGAPTMWSDLSKLFPYATALIGSAIFGATDKTLVITPAYGAPLTLANVAVTRMAPITLAHGKPMLGDMTFTGLCANSGDPATAANWFSFGSSASAVALTGFDLSKVFNSRYSLVRNTVTYRSEEGFNLDFNVGLAPEVVDGEGIVNYRVTEVEAAIRFAPTGNTEAVWATLMGWAVAPGASPAVYDAVLAGDVTGSPSITIDDTMVVQGGTRYGAAVNRFGEVELVSRRSITSGALNALWTISTVA